MKKGFLFPLLLIVAAAGCAQEVGNQDFVPFVSKLNAKVDESEILLTWHNPANIRGAIILFRHSAEIDRENLEEAQRIARLPADQESFRDNPPDDRPYYYAALLEDSSAAVQEILVPFRNKTSRPVQREVQPQAEESVNRITGIRATVADDYVEVLFSASKADKDLLLFRGGSPMMEIEDLIEASAPLQLDPGTSRFVDFPIPGVETYYAVIDTELFKLGKQTLVPEENTTIRGVEVPLEVERVGLPPLGGGQSSASATSARIPVPVPASASSGKSPGQPVGQSAQSTTPLPYLQVAEGSGSSFSFPRRREELDRKTQAAIARIYASATPVRAGRTSVVILPEDRDELPAGESASLRNILQEHLLAGDYTVAESKLQGFLNLRRSPYTEARVRFYLAQAYYFQGLYEEALLEFVLAQGQLYAPVQPWLESCFRLLWERQ